MEVLKTPLGLSPALDHFAYTGGETGHHRLRVGVRCQARVGLVEEDALNGGRLERSLLFHEFQVAITLRRLTPASQKEVTCNT